MSIVDNKYSPARWRTITSKLESVVAGSQMKLKNEYEMVDNVLICVDIWPDTKVRVFLGVLEMIVRTVQVKDFLKWSMVNLIPD